MKILWIVNMVTPELAEHLGVVTGSSGTWMIDISNMLSNNEDIELGIACVYGKEYKEVNINNTKYFMLPGNGKNMLFYTKKYEKMWENVYNSFKPDLVHLHGTEYSHGLSFLRKYPKIKSVVSLQGILNRIKDVDFGGLTFLQALSYRTLRENIRLNGMIEMHYLHKKNANYEAEILRRVSNINGVNTWDTSLAKSINPKLNVFKIDYNLREEFYLCKKWDINCIDRHSIFTNPSGTPLKGLHMLIKAVAIVKRQYPNVKIRVPGLEHKNGHLIVSSGYTKYLAKLIDRLGMAENIEFLGRQSGEDMIRNMQKSHTVIIPSAIEGTSLVLREAMFLGVPSIASFRGGMADFISDKNNGFLYDYQEYPYLAQRIIEIFENDELALKFSQNAIEEAKKAQDREKNLKDYTDMYYNILNDI